MSTPKHCPGYEQFKNLQSFTCKCPACSEVIEIFSDEFDKKHTCKKCGQPIDFTQCTLDAGA
jgi:rRNA maturation endonuclease Nob1